MSSESATKRPRTDEERPTPSALFPAKAFTVVLRGIEFTLSREECEFDSPNYFTACFLSGFSESDTGVMYTNRSPILFPHIQDWLCGYDVFPLPPFANMSPAVALSNLLKDAQYFGLSRLEDQITIIMNPPIVPPHHLLLPRLVGLQTYGFDRVVTLHELLRGECPLEREISKHEFRGEEHPFVSVLGGSFPPIVFMRDVSLTIVHEDLSISWGIINAKVDLPLVGVTADADGRVAVAGTTPGEGALRLDGTPDFSFYKGSDEDLKGIDAHLILDEISTTFSDLNTMLHHAVPVVVSGGPYTTDDSKHLDTPLGQRLLQHLQLSDARKFATEDELGEERGAPAVSTFKLFASELWMIPVSTTWGNDSDQNLKEFKLRIVSAKCHTRGTGMFVLPSSNQTARLP